MALSNDAARIYADQTNRREAALPVQANSTIYAGSALSIDTGGEVGPLNSSDAAFAGFARKGAVGVTAGDTNVAVYTECIVELTITGLNDNNDINDVVYATDDNTFTLTASGGLAIGRVYQIVSLTDNKALVLAKSAAHEHQLD